ncbi:MAG: substrate-binding domain-containing protein [Candidatus Thermoplasmatota archaeon]|nr:substrate-binding domain-containing protein [Candidatus Thermoplasmatota archaeon]
MKEKPRKKLIICIITIVLSTIGPILLAGCTNQQSNIIKISGANALQPMMEVWAKEYQKIYPEIRIDVSGGGAGKGMTEALAGVADIGMYSKDVTSNDIANGVFWVSVASDAVIATMNSQNPVKDLILAQGVTKAHLRDIFINIYENRTFATWGQLVGNPNASTQRIWVFTRQDSCGAAEMWAKYLGPYLQDNLTAAADAAQIEDAGVRTAVQGNVNSIGYNNINTVYDIQTKLPYTGIVPIPLDLNENGILDENESFYNNSTEIINAIRNHIYPWPPARNLQLVTKEGFTGIVKDFIEWILTEGQQYVETSGYLKLPDQTLQLQRQYLDSGTRPEIG